jgi:hypothetical protein
MCQINFTDISLKVINRLKNATNNEGVFWKIIRFSPNKMCYIGPYKGSYKYKPYKNQMHREKLHRIWTEQLNSHIRQSYGIHVCLTRKDAKQILKTLKNSWPSRYYKIVKVIGKLKDFVNAGEFDCDMTTKTAVFRSVYIREGRDGIKALKNFPKNKKYYW